jgi:hypothetical protein
MARQKTGRLNQLERDLPEGQLIDTGWLKGRGYSRQLWNHYVASGRLEQPVRGVFRRPRGTLTWQQVVISLQTLLERPLVLGGRLVAQAVPERPKQTQGSDDSKASDADLSSIAVQPWGQWGWPLTLSTPERAILELLDELPGHESFHQVDKLMEGLTNLSPRRLQELLADCRSVKVKRLFFFFADRHKHAWLKRLRKEQIDLGKGKRMLVKGGRLDHTYQITVPEDLDGVR